MKLILKKHGWYEHSEENYLGFAMMKGNLDDFDKSNFTLSNPTFITIKGWTFIQMLREMSTNPFLPNDIIKILDQIGNNICTNLFEVMPKIINQSIDCLDLTDENIKVLPSYKEFEINRIKHFEDLKVLRLKIRDYLSVDDKW